jgi:hypothetical protein
LETVSADEQQVSKDQTTVSKDEATLAQALATAAGTGSGPSNPSGGSTGNTGTSPTQGGKALDATGDSGAGSAGNTGTGKTDGSGTSPGTSGNGSSGNGSSGNGTSGSGTSGNGGSTNVVTPAQIASDQAAIDTAEADLTEAQQALDEATLTSPISGTVVSVGINVGDTVSAGSSTEIVTIIGTRSYEVQATLDSSQIPLVKTGQSATVEVDGVDGTLAGTVSQVGPVQSTSNGYTYPVIIALPSSSGGLYSGSTANVVISTGEVSHVVAVPTSAVQTLGARSFVLELSQGQLTRKFIKIGMVGVVYTQVDSGLSPGDSVVLVDYADAVPSSNTNSLGGVGSFLGGGGGNTFLGGGPGFFFRPGQAKSVVGGAGG